MDRCHQVSPEHDTLPHNSNLQLWKKKPNPSCPLCGHQRQTLLHISNNCETALHHRRYSQRHDEVLIEIASFITVNLKVAQNVIVDCHHRHTQYQAIFLAQTSDQTLPGGMNTQKEQWKLSLPSASTLSSNRCREKKKKYFNLCEDSHHDISLITLEVGSRGVIHLQGFLQMQKQLDCSKKDPRTLLVRISSTAIQESFKIWCTRNREIA